MSELPELELSELELELETTSPLDEAPDEAPDETQVVAQLQIHPTLRTHIPVKRKRCKS